MTNAQGDRSWEALWRCVGALQERARRLRHLSQEEPLLGARPDFPRARIGMSRAEELREVLDGLLRDMEEARRLIPEVFPDASVPAGQLTAEEAPPTVAERLAALSRIGAKLREDAFQPPPPLPKHAPPYLADTPPPLSGSRALLLSSGLEEVASALRNALLAAVNTRRLSRPGGS